MVGSSHGEVVITTLNDISWALYQNKDVPGLDDELTEAMYASGYLAHINIDRERNPYRYDYTFFKLNVEFASGGDKNELFKFLRQELTNTVSVLNNGCKVILRGETILKQGLNMQKLTFKYKNGCCL